MNATCRANSTCRKIANERKYECPCNSDTVPVSDETGSKEMCLGIFDMIILLSLRFYDFWDCKFNKIRIKISARHAISVSD